MRFARRCDAWLFTGEQHDGSEDLYYLRARCYDSATGRFLGLDPLGIGNGYSYVGNNPVNYVDPYGLIAHGSVIDAVGGCITDPLDCIEEVAEVAADVSCNPYVAAIGCPATSEAGSFVTNSYFDLNVTGGCGNLVFAAGIQFSYGQGIHPYAGGGVATDGGCLAFASFTVAPYQDITTGLNCGLQGSYVFGFGAGPTGQVGAVKNKEGNVNFVDENFAEIGISVGVPGGSAAYTCIYVY